MDKNNEKKSKNNFFKKFFSIFTEEKKEDKINSNEFENIDKKILSMLIKKNENEVDINEFEEVDDNEPNFIILNGKKMRKKKIKLTQEEPKVKKIIDDLINAKSDPYNTNQQRNLDRETGGTELPESYTTSAIDVWDNRGDEIDKMAEITPEDFNSDDKASMIWDKKRKKKQAIKDNAQDNGLADFNKSNSSSRSL